MTPTGARDLERRLHIGGIEPRAGWSILNIQAGPNVDVVGDVTDLSGFDDAAFDEIYASHVLEHISYNVVLTEVIKELHRILAPGGRLMVSVPDLTILCQLFLHPELDAQAKTEVMRMMFGGQTDAHDFHKVGFYDFLLIWLLENDGFVGIERVGDFGLFDDTSRASFAGVPISLNMQAFKWGPG